MNAKPNDDGLTISASPDEILTAGTYVMVNGEFKKLGSLGGLIAQSLYCRLYEKTGGALKDFKIQTIKVEWDGENIVATFDKRPENIDDLKQLQLGL
jgi:hypothetical protein